jgi:hypothetical protein
MFFIKRTGALSKEFSMSPAKVMLCRFKGASRFVIFAVSSSKRYAIQRTCSDPPSLLRFSLVFLSSKIHP